MAALGLWPTIPLDPTTSSAYRPVNIFPLPQPQGPQRKFLEFSSFEEV